MTRWHPALAVTGPGTAATLRPSAWAAANEVLKGMHQKAKTGGAPGKVQIGHRNAGVINVEGREVRTIVVDEQRTQLSVWAFQTYATDDWMIRVLAEKLADRGLISSPALTRLSRKADHGESAAQDLHESPPRRRCSISRHRVRRTPRANRRFKHLAESKRRHGLSRGWREGSRPSSRLEEQRVLRQLWQSTHRASRGQPAPRLPPGRRHTRRPVRSRTEWILASAQLVEDSREQLLVHRSEVLANLTTGVKNLVRLVEDDGLTSLLRQEPRIERPGTIGQRRLTTPEIDQLVEDYRSIRSVYTLAEIYGIHRNTVSQHLKGRGVTIGRRPLVEPEIIRARELHDDGLSLNVIGRALGRDPKTVKTVLD